MTFKFIACAVQHTSCTNLKSNNAYTYKIYFNVDCFCRSSCEDFSRKTVLLGRKEINFCSVTGVVEVGFSRERAISGGGEGVVAIFFRKLENTVSIVQQKW